MLTIQKNSLGAYICQNHRLVENINSKFILVSYKYAITSSTQQCV
jgi:hypothetical protein